MGHSEWPMEQLPPQPYIGLPWRLMVPMSPSLLLLFACIQDHGQGDTASSRRQKHMLV